MAITTSLQDSYEAYGCRVNSICVNDLFRKYEQTGFLYPDKMKRLLPFLPLVRDNWMRSMRGGELIHYVVTAELEGGAWASITSWRSTANGWTTQHLIGTGSPAASRAAMLSTQAVRIRDQLDASQQNWFQRSNRFASKAFGSIVSTVGTSNSWIGDYSYFDFPLATANSHSITFDVRHCTPADRNEVCHLAEIVRSPVFVAAEELDNDDLNLESVDDLYRKVGLRRYRRVLLSDIARLNEPAGVAIVYRGPLGLDFSFLENRVDILINPKLDHQSRQSVFSDLLAAASKYYSDFAPRAIPVTVDLVHSAHICSLGGIHLRDYAQSVWLQDGYEKWYRHVEAIYDRVMRTQGRRVAAANGTDMADVSQLLCKPQGIDDIRP